MGPRICGLGQAGAIPFLNLLGEVPSCSLFYVGVGLQAWGPSHLLSDWAHAQFPLRESSPHKVEGEEEEMEEEASPFKSCVPGIATLQSPTQKTFRSTDTVGKCGASPLFPAGPAPGKSILAVGSWV